MNIPTTVTSLDENCFCRCYDLQKLTIPESFQFIPHGIFMKLEYLKELTLPSQYKLHGDRLFFVQDNCLHSIK